MRFRAWLAVLCVVAALACQAIVGIHDRTLEDSGVSMAQPDASDPCTKDGVPPPPDMSTTSPGDSVDFVAALSQVSLGLSSDAGSATNYGFNLDSTCSCPPDQPSTCVAPPDDMNLCDYENGVDLGGRKIFAIATAAGLVQETELNNGLAAGQWGAMIRVQQWNGKPDDAQVKVSIYSSLGIQGDAGVNLDGNDHWTVDRTSISNDNTDEPKVVDMTASYVTGGKLVSRLLAFPLTIGSRKKPSVFMNLTAAIVVADIVVRGQARVLSGILAGRWAAYDALPALADFKDQSGTNLCGDGSTYLLIKKVLCQNVDIFHLPYGKPTDRCDSSSIGIHFEATEAKFGNILSPPDAGTPCGPSWSDSCQ